MQDYLINTPDHLTNPIPIDNFRVMLLANVFYILLQCFVMMLWKKFSMGHLI